MVLLLAERIIQTDYTQAAEAAEGTNIMDHFQSHPALGDRIEDARNAEPEGATFRPLLADAEWSALQPIYD